MDPNETLLNIMALMNEGEFEDARELARELERWFAKGGFYPTLSLTDQRAIMFHFLNAVQLTNRLSKGK